MSSFTRRAVSIISASLIEQKDYSSIYDYDESSYFNFSCKISQDNVNVYDYEKNCYISGNGNSNSYSLYHYGNSKHIDLNIKQNEFDGYCCDDIQFPFACLGSPEITVQTTGEFTAGRECDSFCRGGELCSNDPPPPFQCGPQGDLYCPG